MACSPVHRPVQAVQAGSANTFWSGCLYPSQTSNALLMVIVAGLSKVLPGLRQTPAYLGLLLCLSAQLLQLCGPSIHAQALLAQLHDPLKVCQLQRSPGASVVPLCQAQAALPY